MIREINSFPQGSITPPPSKSAAHRALICAALAKGVSTLKNVAFSQDISATLSCLRSLGITASRDDPELHITGGIVVPKNTVTLDCGESGTTLRLLIPTVASLSCECRLTGHGRLMERPLGPYLECLTRNGADINLSGSVLSVRGPLKPGRFELPGNISSQFISGLLLALPFLDGDSEIHVSGGLQSASYVDMTLDMCRRFGLRAEHEDYTIFSVKGGQSATPCNLTVESDYSQAAFFLTAGALGRGLECIGLPDNSCQGDRRIVEILRDAGVNITKTARGGLLVPPVPNPSAQTVDVSDIPDLVPPLAAFFSFCNGESRIINAARLRMKESDRLSAVAGELNALGADITELEDSLIIHGKDSLRGGTVSARNDHRIAMMTAVAAIRCAGPVYLEGSECVAKSYPDFWRNFAGER